MSQSRPAEIRSLAGARAIPPLILVLFHYCAGHGYRGAKWFDLPVGKGYLWVEFFFMLSGFVLTYVYGARWREMWKPKSYFRFLATRLIRLYPLHLAMLFIVLAMIVSYRALAAHFHYVSFYDAPYHPINTWPSFVANLFLVQGWNIFPYLTWNGASWFVSVEFLLCLLVPLYFTLSRGGLWSAAALILGGAGGLAWLAATSGVGLDLTYHNGIFRGLAAFAIGVGLSVVFTAIKGREGTPLPDATHSLLQLAAFALFLYAIYQTGWAHRPEDIYTVLGMALLVITLAFDRGILAGALQGAGFRKLGEWSYAIYMGQTALLQTLSELHLNYYPSPSTPVLGRPWAAWDPVWHWLEPALLVLAAIGWGWLLFTLVEQPAAAFLRRLLDGRPRRSAAA